jgi:hypothetical protein
MTDPPTDVNTLREAWLQEALKHKAEINRLRDEEHALAEHASRLLTENAVLRERVTQLEAALREIASSDSVQSTPGVLDRSFYAQEYKRIARAALAGDDAV